MTYYSIILAEMQEKTIGVGDADGNLRLFIGGDPDGV